MFNILLNNPNEVSVVENVSKQFANEELGNVVNFILSRISQDLKDKPDSLYTPPAPPMTQTQRVLLGLMQKLENLGCPVFDKFFQQCELRLLSENKVICIEPITRFYMATCMLKKDIFYIRRFCLDALYFMGDLAIPFIYCALTCRLEIIPNSSEGRFRIIKFNYLYYYKVYNS